jgi:FlaA1/EpsC-like NDP-sugar epimerase
MSVVNVSFGPAATFQGVPTFSPVPAVNENISGGSGSASTTGTAGNNHFARVSTDTAVWITFAATPTAAAGTTFYLPAGVVETFGPIPRGFKCAAIDA